MRLIIISICSCREEEDAEGEALEGALVHVVPVEGVRYLFSSETWLKRILGEGNEENFIYKSKVVKYLESTDGQEGSSL